MLTSLVLKVTTQDTPFGGAATLAREVSISEIQLLGCWKSDAYRMHIVTTPLVYSQHHVGTSIFLPISASAGDTRQAVIQGPLCISLI